MASWLTRVLDKVTPWDRKGERERRDEERRRREDERRRQAQQFAPGPGVLSSPNIRTKQPVNQFQSGQTFDFGKLTVPTSQLPSGDSARASLAEVGVEKPKQSFFNKVRDVFDANTEADKYRRATETTQRLTGQFREQGLDEQKARQTAVKIAKSNLRDEYRTDADVIKNSIADFTYRPVVNTVKGLVEAGRGGVAKVTGNKTAEEAAFRRRAAALFGKKAVEQMDAGQQLGKGDAALAFLNATSVIPAAKGAQIIGQGVREGIRSRAFQPVIRKGLTGIDEAILGVRNFFNRPKTRQEVRGVAEAAAQEGALLTPKQVEDLITREIPVRQGIDVVGDSAPVLVDVRKATPPTGRIIREVGGDATKVTTEAEIRAQQAQRQRERAIADLRAARPDRRLHGVTPRNANAPDTVTTKDIEYERAQLDEALANGEITKAQHKAANKALDETPTVDGKPKGAPIKVKEVKDIPVREVVDIPQGLPKTPGKVRPVSAIDPLAKKTEQAIAATPPAAPASEARAAAAVADTAPAPAMPTLRNIPAIPADEGAEQFLTRIAPNIQENVQRAARALRDLKKTRSTDRSGRVAEAVRARDAVLNSGGTPEEALDAFYSKLGGEYATIDFTGTGLARQDQDRLMAMVREHYADMPFQQNSVQRAFLNLFQTGTDGYKFHIIPSDLKKIRQFLNQVVPDANLGDGAEAALRELANEAGDGISNFDKLIGFQRAVLFSADASATLRQALPSSLRHPGLAKLGNKLAFSYMFNPAKYEARIKELKSDRIAQYMEDRLRVGLAMLEDGGAKGDDFYRNESWVKKVPGVRQVVEASERHYKGLLTEIRYGIAKQFIERNGGIAGLERAASDANSGNPQQWLDLIGESINTLTGRGGKRGGFTERNLDGLVRFLISPRNLASKLQRINPFWYKRLWKGNRQAFYEAASTTATQLAITALALKAAHMAGLYEDGKIKVFNTRYDITGGIATILQSAVEIGQYMTGHKESTPWRNAISEFDSIIKNQLAPAISTFYSIIGSEPSEDGGRVDRFGNKITWPGFFADIALPLSIGGAVEDASEGVSAPQIAVNTGLNMLGIGTNTYQSSEDKHRANVNKVMQDIGRLSKYVPEGEDPTKSDVIKGALDDAFYAGDWDAYYDGVTKKLKDVQANPNATRKELAAAELAQKQAEVYRNRNVTPELAEAYENTEISTSLSSDSVYRQRGDYQTDAELLRLKRDLLAVDPRTKKEELDNLNIQIKRSELLGRQQVPYDLLALYQNTSLSEWRRMGDPESEDYDPYTYAQLRDLDQLFKEQGVSYSSSGFTKNKYIAQSGRGKKLVTSFGTLETSGLPRVRAYERVSLDMPDIPVIRAVRPNIVHKIGRG
jgi:hypothetical protein